MNTKPGFIRYHFSYLPVTLKVFYTSALIVLGLGYLFAILQIRVTHAGLDGDARYTSLNDIIVSYRGGQDDTRLEAALKGPMADMLPAAKRDEIFAWIESGATEEAYEAGLDEIFQQRCLGCHGGQNKHLVNLSDYTHIMEVVVRDEGMSLATLVRVSHIHAFGLTFIFVIVGTIFTHAYVKPTWLKGVILTAPFAAIILDVASWYLTKATPFFAPLVVASGATMGLAFAIQWVISIYQMWFYKPAREIIEEEGAVS